MPTRMQELIIWLVMGILFLILFEIFSQPRGGPRETLPTIVKSNLPLSGEVVLVGQGGRLRDAAAPNNGVISLSGWRRLCRW